jgi:hypothetical protein
MTFAFALRIERLEIFLDEAVKHVINGVGGPRPLGLALASRVLALGRLTGSDLGNLAGMLGGDLAQQTDGLDLALAAHAVTVVEAHPPARQLASPEAANFAIADVLTRLQIVTAALADPGLVGHVFHLLIDFRGPTVVPPEWKIGTTAGNSVQHDIR